MKQATQGSRGPKFLLVGPYDPNCGEYTFLAPPLGVWRLAGVLDAAGVEAEVFDPNCCDGNPSDALSKILLQKRWDVIGISTTRMTLRFDLELAHRCRQNAPEALMVAGGMEATFKPELMFQLGPFDLVVLGEGEKPLLEIAVRIKDGGNFESIDGTAFLNPAGQVIRLSQAALTPEELRDAIFQTPYEEMPYSQYWRHLESAYRVNGLPSKAEREARLSEIRSVRLITLNYCPMNCTFCSSTNFLHSAQGGTAPLARLCADDCITMVKRIVAAQPGVRTIVFQDDIFVFTKDSRILPLCESIVAAKKRGDIPPDLQFISTNRIDAMDHERLTAMRNAGFRVLGFGIENFSRQVLVEFNKSRIYDYIEPNLGKALELGLTPFLDVILTSPACGLGDLAETIRSGYKWLLAGCEVGMYPYVIPFSGAVMADDPSLKQDTIYIRHHVEGTDIEWDQPSKILPRDKVVREAILAIEADFEVWLDYFETRVAHLPSRLRSLLWIACSAPVLAELGQSAPTQEEVMEQLRMRLPKADETVLDGVRPFAEESKSLAVGYA